ncbi:EB module [Ancylostoma ceylanicum]|uniref:EB module n=1 Tax=Ancylostoma ceylanicum TaxID=53326 RepID=A0A0D6LDC2_9BILA|nr:EB module [Ancylostoma ceylanicum]
MLATSQLSLTEQISAIILLNPATLPACSVMGEDNATQSDNVTIQDYKAIDPTIFERHCNDGQPDGKCDETGRCLCPESMKKHYDDRGVAPPLAEVATPNDASKLEALEKSIRKMFSRRNYALRAAQSIVGAPPAQQQARTCPKGQTYVSEAGVCMTVQFPGEPCQYSQQCAAAEPGAYCSRLRCECTHGMRQSGAGCAFIDYECSERGLVFIPELGDCRAAVDGTCAERCAVGQVYSGVAGQCLPTVSPAGQCLYTSQCQAIEQGMTCENSVCRCPNGLVSIKYSGCQGNQIEVDGECLSHALAGEPCRVHAQCTGGASCLKGHCVCPQDMISNGSVEIYAILNWQCV